MLLLCMLRMLVPRAVVPVVPVPPRCQQAFPPPLQTLVVQELHHHDRIYADEVLCGEHHRRQLVTLQ
jgi:hypothetical protein